MDEQAKYRDCGQCGTPFMFGVEWCPTCLNPSPYFNASGQSTAPEWDGYDHPNKVYKRLVCKDEGREVTYQEVSAHCSHHGHVIVEMEATIRRVL